MYVYVIGPILVLLWESTEIVSVFKDYLINNIGICFGKVDCYSVLMLDYLVIMFWVYVLRLPLLSGLGTIHTHFVHSISSSTVDHFDIDSYQSMHLFFVPVV